MLNSLFITKPVFSKWWLPVLALVVFADAIVHLATLGFVKTTWEFNLLCFLSLRETKKQEALTEAR